MTYFHFFRSLFSRAVSDSYQPASAAEGRLTGRNTDNGFGAEVVQRDSTASRLRADSERKACDKDLRRTWLSAGMEPVYLLGEEGSEERVAPSFVPIEVAVKPSLSNREATLQLFSG